MGNMASFKIEKISKSNTHPEIKVCARKGYERQSERLEHEFYLEKRYPSETKETNAPIAWNSPT